ncbi:hypothetical protein BDV11DRAFT_183796 [Aspergillus similis]
MNGQCFDLEATWEEDTCTSLKLTSTQMTGGICREDLINFYRDHFIFVKLADAVMEPLSRTVAVDRAVSFNFPPSNLGHIALSELTALHPPNKQDAQNPIHSDYKYPRSRLYYKHLVCDQASDKMYLGYF